MKPVFYILCFYKTLPGIQIFFSFNFHAMKIVIVLYFTSAEFNENAIRNNIRSANSTEI